MFSLVSSRYERASLIVTSNKPFSAWGEIFGDEVVAAAMIDRLVHHAEILSLKGDSYRLRDRDLGGRPPAREPESTRSDPVVAQCPHLEARDGPSGAPPATGLRAVAAQRVGSLFDRQKGVTFQPALTIVFLHPHGRKSPAAPRGHCRRSLRLTLRA